MMMAAACFAALGTGLLFAADEVTGAIVPAGSSHAFGQLLGSALLGFAAMNWTARGSALGGIYGRAVVAGNQVHLSIGVMVLVKYGFEVGADRPAYWVLAGLYLAGAVYFTHLTFFRSGLRET
jgi:hypothetical protein